MATLLFARDGRRVADILMRSALTLFTWGGGGNAGRVVRDEEASSLARRVIESVPGWEGPVCVEMRRHESTGKLFVMEANCRLNGYSYLATMNGLDFPDMVVDLLLDRPVATSVEPWTRDSETFVLGFREKIVEKLIEPRSLESSLQTRRGARA